MNNFINLRYFSKSIPLYFEPTHKEGKRIVLKNTTRVIRNYHLTVENFVNFEKCSVILVITSLENIHPLISSDWQV